MTANTDHEKYFYENDLEMEGFRAGNRESFKWVYDHMARPLFFYVENLIHSQADSEDIVANAFYKLFHARSGMKSFDHIKRWLYVTVRNEGIDFLRLKVKRQTIEDDVSYLGDDFEVHAETERARAVLFQNILQEIEKLPRQRRTILRYYFFEEKSTHEIAELMKISSQTVLNHKTKALQTLRNAGLKLTWSAILLESLLYPVYHIPHML